ncbi:cytochrome P450 [Antrihabitans spumae]|uniref:Cytochrome P450 n=1 Tax=Antrihabitans spumae TaxID=3373370 RepID=A0ABW7K244_9NOCA
MKLAGPRWPWEFVRDARSMATSPTDGLMDVHTRYGPIARVGFGPFKYIAMLGPEANRFVLSDGIDSLRYREAMSILIPVDGETAMIVSDGEEHRRRRHAVQAAFAAKRIHAYLDVMIDEFGREFRTWQAGTTINALEALRRPIRSTTVRCLFGDAMDTAGELGRSLDITIAFVNQPMWNQYKIDLPWTRWHRAKQARSRTDAIVNAEITRRRAQTGRASNDVLDALLEAENEAGQPALTDIEIRDQVVSLVAASYDTISSASVWALHELMSSSSVREAALSEIDRVVGAQRLTIELLTQMPYLDAIVNETLRLWPPTAISARKVVDAFDFAGSTVPAGTMILYSPYVTHRLADVWDEPEVFRPERWFEAKPDPYAYVPFGGGFRRCIGFIFAVQQLKVLLVELLRTVAITPDYDALTPVGIPALHPKGGLPVRVSRVLRPVS